jgi:AcrR family transcriptional regulator
MTTAYELFGRMNQKTRTRSAIKAAAAEFVRRGETPNMTQIAQAALVSKSTAYRYFPTLEGLLAELMLDITVRPEMETVFAAANTSGTAAERLDAVVRADYAMQKKHEHAIRTALRVMVTANPNDSPQTPRRPGNRLRYVAEALAPLQEQLGSERMERLVMALALTVGMESIVVTEDICGLAPDESEALKRWVAQALLQAALRESDADSAG